MYRGMKLDDYFKYTNSSREDFKKDRKAEAEKNVKTRLVLEQVIKTDKIEPNEEELDARLGEIASSMGKTAEEYKSGLSERQLLHIKSDMTVEKALNELAAATVFTAKAQKADKAEKPTKTATAKQSASPKSASAAKKSAAKSSASKKSTDKKD